MANINMVTGLTRLSMYCAFRLYETALSGRIPDTKELFTPQDLVMLKRGKIHN